MRVEDFEERVWKNTANAIILFSKTKINGKMQQFEYIFPVVSKVSEWYSSSKFFLSEWVCSDYINNDVETA